MEKPAYIDSGRLPYPFCPGCSHGPVLDHLANACQRLGYDPDTMVIVTDIGCFGLSDQYFTLHAFHGLHGRSVLYAEGLKLANPELRVIVLMGDGGAGIGAHHLIHAARRNIGITVIIGNNMNFGMTGGEHSVTTPPSAYTVTTPAGNIESPFKIVETLHLNGAAFVARRTFYDPDLRDVLEKAIACPGFSAVEIMEFCTAYFVPNNRANRRTMEELAVNGPFPRVTLETTPKREEFTNILRSQSRPLEPPMAGLFNLEMQWNHALKHPMGFILAGAAGMKIQSAAILFARAAVQAGLYVQLGSDYPVTVKTGHSLAFLKLSPFPGCSFSMERPDVVFVIAREGQARLASYLKNMGEDQIVYRLADLPRNPTKAREITIPTTRIPKPLTRETLALAILSAYLYDSGIFPFEALRDTIIKESHDNLRDRLSQAVVLGAQEISPFLRDKSKT